MQKRAILFNGPPGSGKDTAAIIARNYLDQKFIKGSVVPIRATHSKFATPLKAAAHTLYGLPYSADHYEKTFGYEWKNKKQMEFFGKSPREVYIALSEDFAKKMGDEHFFGKIAARTIGLEKQCNTFIFSDCGFAGEVQPLIAALGLDNIFIVELFRDGTSFDGDSRGYIVDELNAKYAGKVKYRRLSNNQDKMIYRIMIQAILKEHLNIEDE